MSNQVHPHQPMQRLLLATRESSQCNTTVHLYSSCIFTRRAADPPDLRGGLDLTLSDNRRIIGTSNIQRSNDPQRPAAPVRLLRREADRRRHGTILRP
jgi:hypothetical protein